METTFVLPAFMKTAAWLVPALTALFAGCLVYFFRPRRATVLALLLAMLFGAADQYLGCFPMYPWLTAFSLMAGPWLVLPFVVGGSQREALRGALLGLGCTYTALLGYGLMTLSPIENAHLTITTAASFLHSERFVFIGGLVTGPLFGWFGQQWRVRRFRAGALFIAAAFCLEQLAWLKMDRLVGPGAILWVEPAVGIALAAYLLTRKPAQ